MTAAAESSNDRPWGRRLTSAERHTDILAAARRVFVKHGLAGARTRDIAAEAGVTEALVYQHFRSKNELFEAAVVDPLQEALDHLLTLTDPRTRPYDETGKETLELFRIHVRDLLVTMDEIGPLLGVMIFGDAATAPGFFRDRLAPFLQSTQEFMVAGLRAWPHHEFDAEIAIHSVFATVWFRSTVARLSGQALDYNLEAERIVETMTFGYADRAEMDQG